MLDYIYQQIVTWPGTRNTTPRPSAFKMDGTRVLRELEKEIRYLGGVETVFRVDLNSIHDLRRDGQIVAGRKLASPAVIVEFKAMGVDGHPLLSYPCDTFSVFKDNLRAVAGILEALRTVDRYGGKTGGRQYQGFKALPATTATTLTAQDAAEILERESGSYQATNILASKPIFREAIRAARAKSHPDRNAGRSDLWDAVERARVVLEGYHASR